MLMFSNTLIIFFCQILAIMLVHTERHHGQINSPPLFVFWLLMLVCSIVPLYTELEEKVCIYMVRGWMVHLILGESCLFFLFFGLFNVQTIREIKIENKKLGGKKKGFLSFYSVCLFFVCLCVCLSSLYRLHRLT